MPLINQATVDTATTGKTKGQDAAWAKQTVTIGFHRRLNLKVIAMDALTVKQNYDFILLDCMPSLGMYFVSISPNLIPQSKWRTPLFGSGGNHHIVPG